MTLGVDVGGTFTDLVWWDGSMLRVGKTTTTPDQSIGVESGAGAVTNGRRVPLLVHGTTVATNALLEGTGAVVAVVTPPGFEDLLEIARQDRPSLYDPDVTRPPPLVARHLRFGGAPDTPIPADSIVVLDLDAYLDPDLEHRRATEVAEANPHALVIASTEVSGEYREFERLSTAVLTAYLRPVVDRYLGALAERVTAAIADRVLVMQSNGGLVPADHAGRHAASILLSGPAGGVVAAAAYGRLLGHDTVVSFDMGGTSTDVCRIEGGVPEVGYERTVEGYVCRLPSVAVHTVGAGGGSIAWLDSAGALRVGPRSAGARPGPVAYGRGGVEPTVTDADLLVGRLAADVALADGLVLDSRAATTALARLGDRLDLDATSAARGVIEIIEAHMERAVRRVSVEEGADPSGAALVAFGGAGGMHAAPLASRLGMGQVIVPPYAGVLSALGLLLAAPRMDRSRTVPLGAWSAGRVRTEVAALVDGLAAEFGDAVGSSPEETGATLDMRYVGQSHETTIPFQPGETWDATVERFHAAHQRRNGFSRPTDPVEVVTLRATSTGRPAVDVSDLPAHVPAGEPLIGSRLVVTESGAVDASVYRRAGLRTGTEVAGPAVVVDGESTTWVGPADRVTMHDSGALVIDHG